MVFKIALFVFQPLLVLYSPKYVKNVSAMSGIYRTLDITLKSLLLSGDNFQIVYKWIENGDMSGFFYSCMWLSGVIGDI